ncbi:glycosyltransferase family 2 protein [Mameliella alba]|uniref:glycosyltransferase family 2 protein n=1 Tax=Mameliella alba TaxID=561184 RepID=UPI0013FD9CA5|nr:glycosyltransferase family A protein [Mameliella alba]
MTGPDLSVVVPLYNKRAFIGRALASIAAQEVQPEEVIVVDDGSTDGSAEVVSDFKGLPIRLIRQQNAGVSVARNRGIAYARCDWVAFLDADDEYLPGAIKSMRDARDMYPGASVVFGRSVHGVPEPAMSAQHYELVPDYFDYLLGKGAHEMHSSSVLVRKAAIEAAGLFPPGICIGEDTDTWMRLGCLFSLVRIDSPVSVYHIADGESGWQGQQGTDPYWFATYAQWRDAERIPAERRRSAGRYLEFCKLQQVIFHALARQRGAAFRKLFMSVRWTSAPKVILAKTLLIALMPSLIGRTDRSRKRRIG